MRTLDDFAFVKEAGFNNVYKQIGDTLDLYDKVPLRIYCEQYRNPLDAAIEAIYYLAGIKDAIVPNGLSGDNIGRLKRVMPEDVFIKSGGENLLTSLNTTCSPYHHKSGWPPEEEWNKDAEKCYKLMVEICRWLITYKKDIAIYLKDNGPILWKQVLAKKKEELQALPDNNSAAHTFPTQFDDTVISQLDNVNKYKQSLEKDLEFYYNKMYKTATVFVNDYCRELDSVPLPEDVAEVLASVKLMFGIFPLVAASAQVLFYDALVHPILFSHNWKPELIKDSPFSEIEILPSEYIFKGLSCINTYAVCKAIGTLSCSQSQIESLQNAFKNQNEESFNNGFKKLTCDISALQIIASFVPFSIKRDYGMMFKPEETFEWMLSSGTPLMDILYKHGFHGIFDKTGTDNLSKQELIDRGVSLVNTGHAMMQEGLSTSLSGLIGIKQCEEWSTLFPFEKDYVNKVLDNEDVQFLLQSLSETFPIKTDVPTPDTPLSNSPYEHNFDLPESFFSGSYPRDARNTDQHFNLDYDVEKCGGNKFAQLINTIASWGFISSSDTEKQKLVYILSGRYKPNGYEREGLEWIDNGYGYELLYVIKYITGNEKGKYEKARKLFRGPQWLGKGDFKDQADYADAGFRRALNDIYPDVCMIKGHVETVREPIRESNQFHIPDNPIKPETAIESH